MSLQESETLFNLNAFYTEILKFMSNDLPIPTKTLLQSKTCPKSALSAITSLTTGYELT